MNDKTIKEKWIDALRSNQYKQTKQVLRDCNGFCCLGVLCDTIDGSKWKLFEGSTTYLYTSNGNSYMYPTEEIRTAVPGLTIEKMCKLSNLNDLDNKTFPEIADYIEANL